MSSLQNLIDKIISDCKEDANNIITDAKEKENEILSEEIKKAEEKKNEIITKAKLECESKKQRIISNAHLSVRNDILEAKQKIIDKVYDEALKKLTSMTKQQYLSFIQRSIMDLKIHGDEEMILSKDEKFIDEDFIKNINDKLKPNCKITISDEKRNFAGGFILAKDGIEINNTFEALISSLKDDVEANIINILFS